MVNDSGKEEAEEGDCSTLSQVEPIELSEDEVQDYVAAVDQIHDIISRLSALDWAEREKSDADSGRLERIHNRQMYFADARYNLRMTDREAVREIRRECSRIRVSGDFGID